MPPPTKIVSRKEALKELESNENCQLKELIQYQCGVSNNEIICVPFKRVFEQCISHDGNKTLYEITLEADNDVSSI